VEDCRDADCRVDDVRPSEGEGCAALASRAETGTELRSGAIFVASAWLVIVARCREVLRIQGWNAESGGERGRKQQRPMGSEAVAFTLFTLFLLW
jgi:hypothetical protein